MVEVSDNVSDFAERQEAKIIASSTLGKPYNIEIISVPETFDSYNEYQGLITLSLDQTVCGDCYAFATATSMSDILRIQVRKKYPNIRFPLNEYIPWFFTLNGTTSGSFDVVNGTRSFNLSRMLDFIYTTLNNISPYALVILEPDYNFLTHVGKKGSICDGGSPQLVLEVVLGPNLLEGQCRSVSVPLEFPPWTKARFVYIDPRTDTILNPNSDMFISNNCGIMIPKSSSNISSQTNNLIIKKYLSPIDMNQYQQVDKDECCRILSGGCPLTTAEDLLHKYIPSLYTGFECESVSSRFREEVPNFEKYCITTERLAVLYFTQPPFSDFNYQIDGYSVIIQRNSKNPSEILIGDPNLIEDQIKSYVVTMGPMIVNMFVPSNFITWFPMYQSEEEYRADTMRKYQSYQTGRLYYPIGMDHNNPVLPVFSESSGQNIGIHSLNIIGWGLCENSQGDKQKYWLARNSWGIMWGNKGTFMILDRNNQISTYITSLSTVAINVDNQVDKIASHFSNYKIKSSFENPLNDIGVRSLFQNQ